MSKFDPTKPVRRRDGYKARILTTEARSTDYPIVALVESADGEEMPQTFTKDGRFNIAEQANRYDLVNVPEKHKFWANIYSRDTVATLHETRSEADNDSAYSRIACIRIEFEEGEGL